MQHIVAVVNTGEPSDVARQLTECLQKLGEGKVKIHREGTRGASIWLEIAFSHLTAIAIRVDGEKVVEVLYNPSPDQIHNWCEKMDEPEMAQAELPLEFEEAA